MAPSSTRRSGDTGSADCGTDRNRKALGSNPRAISRLSCGRQLELAATPSQFWDLPRASEIGSGLDLLTTFQASCSQPRRSASHPRRSRASSKGWTAGLAVALFGVGAYTAVTLVGDWRRSGLKFLTIGLGAAAIGFVVGRLFNSAGA